MTRIEDFGALQVTLLPAEAVNAGAHWRLDGGPWQNSGDIVYGLPFDQGHTVSFSSVRGWTTPPDQTLSVVAGTTREVTAAYSVTPFGLEAIQLNGSLVSLAGSQGISGAVCYVFMSTNLSLPFGGWSCLATNTLSSDSNLTITFPIPTISPLSQIYFGLARPASPNALNVPSGREHLHPRRSLKRPL